MHLGKIEGGCRHMTAINWFHHNQSYHPEYGLVWHNGQSVFLTALQFKPNQSQLDQSEPKAVSPSLTLGQFDENVVGVCWGQDETVSGEKIGSNDGQISHLCVQHTAHVSVWAVSGKYPSIVCKKQSEHKVKSISQGCLWHPIRPILCVVSYTELHLFNVINASWTSVRCDGKSTSGCWVRDGSSFILASCSEIKVWVFNPVTQLLEPPSSMSHISKVQPHLHSSIKAMVPVTDDIVAIATDLPLDHLICHPQDDGKENKELISTVTTNESSARFPLLIPKEKIVQNPIAEMFKVDGSAADVGTSENHPCLHGKDELVSAVSSVQADFEQGVTTVQGKLDQILNLMKRMDKLPDTKQKVQRSEKSMSERRRQVEATLSEGRSGPVDITSILGSGSGGFEQSNVSTIETSQSIDDDNLSSLEWEILNGSERHADASEGHASNSKSFDEVSAIEANKSCSEASVCSSGVLTHAIENQLKGRGPVDVTALLASKSAGQSSYADEHYDQNDRNKKLEAREALDAGRNTRDEDTGDMIDLTGLKTNKIEGSKTQIAQVNQEKSAGTNDAAKLSLIHVNKEGDYRIEASVDLAGILTPDLLHYEESTRCFVVGTNTQKTLQIYQLQSNKLESCEKNIILPDSYRPLGVCSAPGSLSDILVLAGEVYKTDTDTAFLSFTSKVEMDLKLVTYTLPTECLATNANSYHTDVNYSYQWQFGELPKMFKITFDVKAKNDVHIGLSPENTDRDHMYEIVIGGWSNTQSVIRRCKQGRPLTSSDTQNILDPVKFTTFTIDWDGCSLQVFKDSSQIPFLVYTDVAPLDVRFLGFSTGFGSEGDFQFKHLPQKASSKNVMDKSLSTSSSEKLRTLTEKADQESTKRTVCPFPSTSEQQKGWKFSHGIGVPRRVGLPKNKPWKISDRGKNDKNELKYPFAENADVLHLVCNQSGGDVSKLLLLNQHLLNLESVKEAFELTSVEMEIGDKWVVLTEDSDGYIPLSFHANAKYNIRETKMEGDD